MSDQEYNLRLFDIFNEYQNYMSGEDQQIVMAEMRKAAGEYRRARKKVNRLDDFRNQCCMVIDIDRPHRLKSGKVCEWCEGGIHTGDEAWWSQDGFWICQPCYDKETADLHRSPN